jgi:serine/threonine-protein kinase
MVSRHGACDTNRLRRLLDDPPAEEGAACDLAEHLEHCEKCRRELEGLAGGAWWNDVRPFVRPRPDGEAGARTSAHDTPAEEASLGFLSPPDGPGHIGRFGPYQILGVVGRGGFSVVLKAWDPALARTVAVKVLAPQLAASGAARQRFAREAKAAAAVVHPHVVAIHTVDTDPASGLPYLVMPFVPGRSLQDRIDREGPLDVKEVLRIGMQAAQGLAAAHAQGIVHRDVKPANILLENGVERVVLTDFGLARAADDASVTQSGVIAGTPQYMAPEQARGEAVDHRADLFSLGSVLYAMCTGRPPFRADSALAVLRRVSDDRPRPVRHVNPAVPAGLARLIEKLHEKDPDARCQSAAEAAEALERLLAGAQHPGRNDDAPAAPAGRRRLTPPDVAVLSVVLLGAGLVATYAWQRHRMELASAAALEVPAPPEGLEAPEPPLPPMPPAPPDLGDALVLRMGEELPISLELLKRSDAKGCILDVPWGRKGEAFQVVFGRAEGGKGEKVVGSGKPATKDYDLRDFTALDISGVFAAELRQGKEFKVSVTADDNLFDHLRVEKKDNVLHLGFKEGNVRFELKGKDPVKAAVTLPVLERLRLHGAARASAEGFKSDRPLQLRVDGASRLKGDFRAGEVTVDAGGAAAVELTGSGKVRGLLARGASRLQLADFKTTGDGLVVEAEGASSVTLKGEAKAAVLKADGASHLNLADFRLEAADVTLEGASHANLRVSTKLDYTLSGSSYLTYAGDPKVDRAKKSGSSHVSRKKS